MSELEEKLGTSGSGMKEDMIEEDAKLFYEAKNSVGISADDRFAIASKLKDSFYRLKAATEIHSFSNEHKFNLLKDVDNEGIKVQAAMKLGLNSDQKYALLDSITDEKRVYEAIKKSNGLDEDKKFLLLDKMQSENIRFNAALQIEGLEIEHRYLLVKGLKSSTYRGSAAAMIDFTPEQKIALIDGITDEETKYEAICGVKGLSGHQRISLSQKMGAEYQKKVAEEFYEG